MSMSKMVIKQSALLFVVTLGSVQAATLEFIQPIGNVLPNESIDVWVRLTADSGDLSFDLSDPDDDGTYGNLNSFGAIPTGGFNDTGEFLEFSSIDNVYPSLSFLCTGSFAGDDSSPCPPGANYEFNFNTSGSDSFLSLNDFMLPSGTSEDFLFGTFNPVAGGANPGSYENAKAGANNQIAAGRGTTVREKLQEAPGQVSANVIRAFISCSIPNVSIPIPSNPITKDAVKKS